MIQGANILITGGAGFIGTSLTQRLCSQNQVILFDNLHRDAFSNTALAQHPNVRLIQGDVLDLEGLRRAAEGTDMIIHLASIAGVDTVLKNPTLTMRVSLQGTLNALEIAHQSGACRRFVDFSTSEVFGQYAYKVREGDATQLGAVGEARWTYAVSKLATEHLALSYFKQFDLPALSVRPFNIYGPNQVGSGAVHHFVTRALRGDPLVIHGDGSQIRAWCYIDDIIDGVLSALERDEACGHAFNIGNPRSTVTIYHLAREIVQLASSKSQIIFQEMNYTDVELRIPNIDKARELLGFEPKVNLEEGLLRTIDWYRQQM
ncbi:NAD-dependent epimerase/dehydratase family protein [Myxococcota bacterium]|nr:NAD-dependent epimerase/dehydratase family protein [Myxococcota bacterium]MBU1900626.1 NAD-dependent epimerase/dehydratase family protein [Myxococcota bacterium]